FLLASFFFYSSASHRDLHSFPTRRSSDLSLYLLREWSLRGGRSSSGPPSNGRARCLRLLLLRAGLLLHLLLSSPRRTPPARLPQDRKSTRLNSSHDQISYAVFCLKKKTKS